MQKPELEYFDTETLPWTAPAGGLPGMHERVLAADPATGDLTRLAKWDAGVDTTPLGVQAHDFWEELIILDGSMVDLTLNQTFRKGYYACRPPGMRHGPWRTDDGCVTFEIRIYEPRDRG